MFPYQADSGFSANSPLGQSHEFASYFYEWNAACCRTGCSSVECHPIRQQQQQWSCSAETKTKATRTLFPHWGHLPERNVTTASPQWDKHSVCVCASHSHLQTLPPPWPWERHASASLQGSISNVYMCVCTYQHMFMYILSVLLLFSQFQFHLRATGTNFWRHQLPSSTKSRIRFAVGVAVCVGGDLELKLAAAAADDTLTGTFGMQTKAWKLQFAQQLFVFKLARSVLFLASNSLFVFHLANCKF